MKCNPLGSFSVATGSRALALSVALAATVVSSASAATYTEIGDTGNVPVGAQQTPLDLLDPTLTQIDGILDEGNDIDMFQIFIPFGQFSATVSSALFDSQLFLFDINGFGVVSNDDSGSALSSLTFDQTNPLGNYYYLAIGIWDLEPFTDDGISPTLVAMFDNTNGTNGPTAAGSTYPIVGWSEFDTQDPGYANIPSGSYSITLTGAEGALCPTCNQVPDSGTTLGLLGLSLGGLFLGARKLKAKA